MPPEKEACTVPLLLHMYHTYYSAILACKSKLSIESDVKVCWGDECEMTLSGVNDHQLRHVPRGAFLKPLGSGLLLPIFCNFLLRCTGVSDSAPAGYFTEERQFRRRKAASEEG